MDSPCLCSGLAFGKECSLDLVPLLLTDRSDLADDEPLPWEGAVRGEEDGLDGLGIVLTSSILSSQVKQ